MDKVGLGVGGRQGVGVGAARGGGYLENCTPANFSRNTLPDPRLEELARLGLQREWLAVAELLGVDAFLAAWRVLDTPDAPRDDSGTLTLPLRRYSQWLRWQRNQHIRALRAAGLRPSEVRERLKENYGEELSASQLRRIR